MNQITRTKIAIALINAKIDIEDIIDCYRSQDDFNEKVTRYQLRYIMEDIRT